MSNREFEKPLFIASHFGFSPIDAPRVSQKDIDITEDCGPSAAEKAAFLRVYIERNMSAQPHPLALSWKRGRDYSLELVGFPAGVAEAKLIRASLSILTEEGHKNLVVEINSIGDKDSIAAYERELHSFARKSQSTMSPELKKLIKDDIFALVKAHGAEVDALKKDLPSSIASLSAASRGEFKEVLAYLEALGVDFRFAPELVGERNMCSETLFNIRDEANTLLASGFHYSRLSKRFGFKKELPLMGVTIFGDVLKPAKTAVKTYKELPKPKFYLVQLGREAKMKALPLIELLRVNHIPIYHFLGKDKITSQLEKAESLRSPYLLIIGQKEALEDSVTIRNVSTRAQDTISMKVLPQYLKHLPL